MASYTQLRHKYNNSMMAFYEFMKSEDSQVLNKLWCLITFQYYSKKSFLENDDNDKNSFQEQSMTKTSKIKDILSHNLNEMDIFKNKNRKMISKEKLVTQLIKIKKIYKNNRKKFLKFQIKDVSKGKTKKIVKLLFYIILIYVFLVLTAKLNDVQTIFFLNSGIFAKTDKSASNRGENLSFFFNFDSSELKYKTDTLLDTFDPNEVYTLEHLREYLTRTLDYFKNEYSAQKKFKINEFTELTDWKGVRYTFKKIKLPISFIDKYQSDKVRHSTQYSQSDLLRIFVFPPKYNFFNFVSTEYDLINDNYFKNNIGN